MPSPDLRGTVVVLMHPRTGSSLVMQTLRLLGRDVVGAVERSDLRGDGNPKGYFEDRDLLRDGLDAAPVARNPALLRDRAVKIALTGLVRNRPAEWGVFEQAGVPLVLPLRAPAETLVSVDALLLHGKRDAALARKLFQSWVANYLVDIGFIAARASRGYHPACIDYALAHQDPGGYVASVARAARLSPSGSEIDAAAANIDRALYRNRPEVSEPVQDAARGLRPLEIIHDILRSDAPGKWERARRELPDWAKDV